MAYVEQWPISSRSYEGNSIAYVMNDLKTEYEFVSGINCISETALCALENFRKEEFIGYMKDMGYKVKWENKNISFKDEGHKNFIKGRMLSEDYTKEAIENRLGIFEGRDKGKELDTNREASREFDEKASGHRESTEINVEEPGTNIRGAKRKRKYKSEWERYRRSSEVQKASMVGKVIDDKKRKEDNILYQELKLALILMVSIIRLKKLQETCKEL